MSYDELLEKREAENGYREISGKEFRIRAWAERRDKFASTSHDPLISRLRARKWYRDRLATRKAEVLAQQVPTECPGGCGAMLAPEYRRGPRREWCSARCYARCYMRARRAAVKAAVGDGRRGQWACACGRAFTWRAAYVGHASACSVSAEVVR